MRVVSRTGCILLVAVVLTSTAPLLGTPLFRSARPAHRDLSELSIEPETRLESIRARELAIGPYLLDGGASFAGNPHLVLWREVPVAWEVWWPKELSQSLNAHYALIAANGKRNRLSHVANPESEIRVQIRHHRPTRVAEEDQFVMMRGSVSLGLSLGSVRYAGTYSGTLTITVNQI